MYKLKKLNVVRIVAEEKDRDALIANEFTLVGETEPDFTSMTVDELKAYAEGKGANLGKAAKKDEIIAAIKAALAASSK